MEELLSDFEKDLARLLNAVEGTDIREIVLEDGERHVRLRRTLELEGDEGASVNGADDLEPEAPEAEISSITAPLVGTFYRAAEAGEPLVEEGSTVDEHTVVGIIEALHVLTEVEAGVQGTVSRVFASDGAPVEYGQALFEVTPGG